MFCAYIGFKKKCAVEDVIDASRYLYDLFEITDCYVKLEFKYVNSFLLCMLREWI